MRKLTLFTVAAAGLAIAATSAEARMMSSELAVPEATVQQVQYYYGGGYYYRPRYYAPRYYAPRYYAPRYRYYY